MDLPEFCRVLTSFTSSRCLIGREFREGIDEEFADVYRELERGITPIAYINARLPIPSFIRRDRARARMLKMIKAVVASRRHENMESDDFLQTLMEARYSDGRRLDEHEITGLLLAGMFAGHHTSAVTIAWTVLELLANPDRLALVRSEIDEAFEHGGPVSHAALRSLVHTENAVKEALRLHPPLFMLVRVAKQDFLFRDWFIPKNTWVVVSPTVSHRIPEVFAEPDRFDPDRFLPPRREGEREYAFIPFGGGRHHCLGSAFALLQIKAILVVLLRQFDLRAGSAGLESDFNRLVVGPKEPWSCAIPTTGPVSLIGTNFHENLSIPPWAA